jgi:hypothetical protein
VIQCNEGEERLNVKKKYLRDLSITLINNDTDDNVRRIINECVYAWIYNKEIPLLDDIIDNPSNEIRCAYNTQTYLGWHQFFRGRLTKGWAAICKSSTNINHSLHQVSPEKWGRNKIEHSTEDTVLANARKRLKLILKIIWLQEKNKGNITEYGEKLTIGELDKLPLSNLVMMESQFSLVKNQKETQL